MLWFVVQHQHGAGNVAEEVVKDRTTDEVALPIHTAIETTGMRLSNLYFILNLLLWNLYVIRGQKKPVRIRI